jgi:membrane associated rhomboid family serine protease
MVASTIDAEDRSRSAFLLKAGFTLLVGASGGLVSFFADAGVEFAAVAVLVGLVVGAALTWFVARSLRQIRPEGLAERRKRSQR